MKFVVANALAPSPEHAMALKAALSADSRSALGLTGWLRSRRHARHTPPSTPLFGASSPSFLPHLQAFLQTAAPPVRQAHDPWAWSSPAECVQAAALGLPSQAGHIPWAAFESRTWGQACAWLTPTHWQVGIDRITQNDPALLQLDEAQSRAFLDLMRPWFTQAGWDLDYHSPLRWLLRSRHEQQAETLRHLACASLSRTLGRSLDPWLPDSGQPQGASLRRLQNEMQMLLYTQPLNDERSARGLPPVNAFWLHGAGQIDAEPPPPSEALHFDASLDNTAAHASPALWCETWRQVDAAIGQALQDTVLDAASTAPPPQASRTPMPNQARFGLYLCGDSEVWRWQSPAPSARRSPLWSWLAAHWPRRGPALLEQALCPTSDAAPAHPDPNRVESSGA